MKFPQKDFQMSSPNILLKIKDLGVEYEEAWLPVMTVVCIQQRRMVVVIAGQSNTLD